MNFELAMLAASCVLRALEVLLMGWLFLGTVPTQVAASSTPPTAPTRPAAREVDAA